MSRSGIRPLYTLRQITLALGMDRRTVLKILETCGVHVVRAGYRIYIPIVELEAKAEAVWRSLQLAERTTKRLRGRDDSYGRMRSKGPPAPHR
jgi:hypothetical protein